MTLLAASAFSGDVVADARRLLGCVVRTLGDEPVAVRLPVAVRMDEVEAYAAEGDPASHAFSGRTPRNAAMFGPPGNLYVYRSYGIHWCMNIVVGDEGMAGAVLLRGGEVVEGLETAIERRGRSDHLADGPGKLCQALGVTGEMNGSKVNLGVIELVDRDHEPADVVATPRIGISKAVDRPWRFVVRG